MKNSEYFLWPFFPLCDFRTKSRNINTRVSFRARINTACNKEFRIIPEPSLSKWPWARHIILTSTERVRWPIHLGQFPSLTLFYEKMTQNGAKCFSLNVALPGIKVPDFLLAPRLFSRYSGAAWRLVSVCSRVNSSSETKVSIKIFHFFHFSIF
jgi:hypothetical protein